MKVIETIEELQMAIAKIRNLHKGFVTNFYLDEDKHNAWIRSGNFNIAEYDETIFFLYDHETPADKDYFTNLFFVSTSLERMAADMNAMNDVYDYDAYYVDFIGRKVQCNIAEAIMANFHRGVGRSLVRMSHVGEMAIGEQYESVRYAEWKDLTIITKWLHEFFNPHYEQLPLKEELEMYIQRQNILVCEEDGKVAGFLIYQKAGATLYLRYWFVYPDYREKKVGSRLLKQFFYIGKDTKRQILWVITDNENAIKRYEHYGFVNEDMYDYIFEWNHKL